GRRHHPGAGDPRRAPGCALRPAPAPGQRPPGFRPGRRRMRAAGLAWRQLRRDVAAGDVRILAAALVLAVVAVTAVGFVTDRAERALALQANTLLGGDAVVRGDSPIAGEIAEAARAPGLQSTQRVELSTMVRVGSGDDSRLQMGEL